MALSKVEKELRKSLNVKPEEGENRQAFLSRVAQALAELDDTAWDDMSVDALEYSNAIAKAMRAEKKLPDFPGADTADEDEPRKPAKKTAGKDKVEGGSAKADEADEKPKAKSRGKPAARGDGERPSSMMFARHFIIDNFDSTVDEVISAVVKAGYNAPTKVTIGTVRSEVRAVLRILAQRGELKRDTKINVSG
jgi:hypothetical protein